MSDKRPTAEYPRKRYEGGAHLEAASMFGMKNQRGLVTLRLGGSEVLVRPSEARSFAEQIIGAAAAAEGDEAFVQLVMEIGLDVQQTAAALLRLRQIRDKQYHEHMAEDGQPDAGPVES